jgi:hypothetical protein
MWMECCDGPKRSFAVADILPFPFDDVKNMQYPIVPPVCIENTIQDGQGG